MGGGGGGEGGGGLTNFFLPIKGGSFDRGT